MGREDMTEEETSNATKQKVAASNQYIENNYKEQIRNLQEGIERHKCSACFKQYKKKEHLIEHMRDSYHSVHQPKCGACQKHSKTFESLREHITGPLAKAECSNVYANQGCFLCLKVFDDPTSLIEHKEECYLPVPVSPLLMFGEVQTDISNPVNGTKDRHSRKAVAIDCEMVGGGSDKSLDICARVCLVDEDENCLFHTYVQPQIEVTNYRYEVTGITEEYLRNAMPLKEVQERLLLILHNGERIGKVRLNGGKAFLLVGHAVDHDLNCLKLFYPHHLIRDTAQYQPLMKTNLVSHSLKYLTRTYLGYDIQSGLHDPYIDSVSAMRLYKRMRSTQDHGMGTEVSDEYAQSSIYGAYYSLKPNELNDMSPDELFNLSRSNYHCWCLDGRQQQPPELEEEEEEVERNWRPWE
ncbi:uncharacterized protein LOC124927614 [Impatiens glandulifera]|uniref:uncharacterized protein LOC124927614 n=1 Tax=Impatiens glandulifera TaxID=253017 RepID=UPI001FB0C5FB|nr:uncharacterized protein LOC124927614 [Impatiens glandulifera]